jgi:hypothetical protein
VYREHDCGKQKTPTAKHLLVVKEITGKVVSLGPTVAGKRHDKKAADAAPSVSPTHAPLDKDTGVQGYEPDRVLTTQPKKSRQAKSGAWVIAS